ncbi:hypothetical protein C8J56DRAFT_949628 [Mycena floridula]|nr:hypothetical protein C8J56DRAFT_949628 [Mycena floridula]
MSSITTHELDGISVMLVDIPPPAKNIVDIGKMTQEAPTTRPPSSCSSKTVAKHQSRVRHRAQLTDRGSALTGSRSLGVQLIHLVSEVTGHTKDTKALKRASIEALLNRQEFNGRNRTFELTSLSNSLLLEPALHTDLDLYALWTLTAPIQQLLDAYIRLAGFNVEWEARAKEDPNAKRNLDTSQAPFLVNSLAVVVLHPLFKPNNEPFSILNSTTFDRQSRSARARTADWQQYHVNSDLYGLADAQGNPLGPLPFITLRNADEKLSLFALVTNSYSKLRSAMTRFPDLPPRHPCKLYWEPTKALIREIFFVPREVRAANSIGLEVSAFAPSSSQSEITPKAANFSHSGFDMQVDHSTHIGGSSSDNMVDGIFSASSSSTSVPGLVVDDYDKDEDEDEDEDEGHRNDYSSRQAPLTAEEIQITYRRATDGNLDVDDRVDSALLLLGMAGTHPLPPMFPTEEEDSEVPSQV